jgi:predicted HTH domain antitoxin
MDIKHVTMEMGAEMKMITTEIHLPGDILYSQGIGKNRAEYFVKKNFLLELYREGKISLGKMAELLDMNLLEMLGIMKDSNVPLNYGVAELEEDIETANRLGLLDEDSQ